MSAIKNGRIPYTTVEHTMNKTNFWMPREHRMILLCKTPLTMSIAFVRKSWKTMTVMMQEITIVLIRRIVSESIISPSSSARTETESIIKTCGTAPESPALMRRPAASSSSCPPGA